MTQAEDTEALIAIGEIALTMELTTRTLRYWEEMGIIESCQRAEGESRAYTQDMVRRIRFIVKLKELGLTIKELQELYAAYGDAKRTDAMIPRLLEMLDLHINMVDVKMAKLSSLRKEIVAYRQKMVERFKLGGG
jgi:DNA-binding transcriptional MerR regulator